MPKTHMARFFLALTLLAVASACSSREGVIRKHLVRAGLAEPMARCMAEPLARNLSDAQLRRLAELGAVAKTDMREISYGQALEILETAGDPQMVQIVLRTAGGCALRP